MTDLYETLGVKKDATQAEIKSAYRKGVKKHHPDANQGNGTEAFVRLGIAYQTLSDEEARAHYDATGEPPNTKIDVVADRARGLLGSIMATLLEREDLLTLDFPKAVLADIAHARNMTKEGTAAAKKLRIKLVRLQKAHAKLKSSREDDILIAILSTKINATERNAESIEREVELSIRAIDLAEQLVKDGNYQWTPDAVDPMAAPPPSPLLDLLSQLAASQRSGPKQFKWDIT